MKLYDIETEKYLLASLILDIDFYSKIDKEYFYDKRNYYIYQIISTLKDRNIKPEITTIVSELEKESLINNAGGIEYITSLMELTPTSANIEYYTGIITEKYTLRMITETCSNIINKIKENDESEIVLEELEKSLYEIQNKKNITSLSTIKDGLYDIVQSLIEKNVVSGDIAGFPTGYYIIDELTDGLQNSDLIIIAARPGMGKTAFALNIISNSSKKYKKKIGFFSCEMTKKSLITRMISAGAKIDSLKMRKNMLLEEERVKIVHEAEKLYEGQIIFDDTPNIQLQDLKTKARKMKKDYGVEIIFIDYLQLLSVDNNTKKQPRHEQIAYISRSLKGLARSLDIPIVALAQLNREIENRGENSRPRLSDLKDSGSIEQDADIIFFIHKPKNDNFSSLIEPREIIIGKNRSGPIGILNFIFMKNFTRFEVMRKEKSYD